MFIILNFRTDICKFPRHPHNGLFSALGIPNAEPGSLFSTLYVTITCHFGYTPSYMSTTACFNGTWLDRLPRCVSKYIFLLNQLGRHRCSLVE